MLESRTLLIFIPYRMLIFFVCCRSTSYCCVNSAWRTFYWSRFLLRTTLTRIFVVFLTSSLVMYILWVASATSTIVVMWGQNLTHNYLLICSRQSQFSVINLRGQVRETASTNWASTGSERVGAATGRVPFPSIILFSTIHKQINALPAHYILANNT